MKLKQGKDRVLPNNGNNAGAVPKCLKGRKRAFPALFLFVILIFMNKVKWQLIILPIQDMAEIKLQVDK